MPGEREEHSQLAGQPGEEVAPADVGDEADPGLGHRKHGALGAHSEPGCNHNQ